MNTQNVDEKCSVPKILLKFLPCSAAQMSGLPDRGLLGQFAHTSLPGKRTRHCPTPGTLSQVLPSMCLREKAKLVALMVLPADGATAQSLCRKQCCHSLLSYDSRRIAGLSNKTRQQLRWRFPQWVTAEQLPAQMALRYISHSCPISQYIWDSSRL